MSIIVIIFSIIMQLNASAEIKPETGFLNRSVKLDQRVYRYQVYVPSGYDADKSWPVILFLHGAGERGDDGIRPTDVGLGHAIRANPERFPIVAVFPQMPLKQNWDKQARMLAYEEMMQAVKEFHGDSSRLYLTGLSSGANASLEMIFDHPTSFAAVAIASGGTQFSDPKKNSNNAAPAEGLYAGAASVLKYTPIWIFHGERDDQNSSYLIKKLIASIKKAEGIVKYTEYSRVDHHAWDQAFSEQELWKWMLSQRTSK